MRIEEICDKDRERALELVLSVFIRYDAPDYTEEGIRTFRRFIRNLVSYLTAMDRSPTA